MVVEQTIKNNKNNITNNNFREISPLVDLYSIKYFGGIKNCLEYGKYLLDIIPREEFSKISSNEGLVNLFKKLDFMFLSPRTFKKIKNEIELYGYKKIKSAIATVVLFDSIKNLDVEGVKFAIECGAILEAKKHNSTIFAALSKAVYFNLYNPHYTLVQQYKSTSSTLYKVIEERVEEIKKLLQNKTF